MEMERRKQSEQDVQPLIEKMRNKGKYSEEIIQLVKEDLMLGFKKTDTDQYLERKYDIRQMRIYSDCLRNDYPQEAIAVICEVGLNANQMQVLLDMYRKGVSLDAIKTIMADAEGVPQRMNDAFEKMQDKLQEANAALTEKSVEKLMAPTESSEGDAEEKTVEEITETQKEYVSQIVADLKEVVEKINFQESRYDELNQKLKSLETSKNDEAIRQGLVDEITEKDKQLAEQQDEISKANSAIARLRNDKEQSEMKLKQEKVELQDEVEELRRKLKNKELDLQDAESKVNKIHSDNNLSLEGEDKMQYKPKENIAPQLAAIPQQLQLQGIGIPVYYQVPVLDGRGQVIQQAQIECMHKKSNGVAGILGKLGFKKKSRADIVKLVASGELVPAQLVQIKSAIERGLTEGQLVELINNNVAAEKMKEIIEIAVLENQLA